MSYHFSVAPPTSSLGAGSISFEMCSYSCGPGSRRKPSLRSAPGLSKTAAVRVIAAGRASEIVDLGDGRVLRRFKGHGDPAREAAVMEHARAHGFPVPEVFEVRDDGLVLELVDGPTMLADLGRRPWRLARHARTLAACTPACTRSRSRGSACFTSTCTRTTCSSPRAARS